MVRKSTHALRRGIASPFALALALAAGGVIGSAAMTAPAFAKDKKEEKAPVENNSKGFAKAYEPMAAAINAGIKGGDASKYTEAQAMLPQVEAAIENETDKFTFANALVALGGQLKSKDLQEKGIRMSLDTGKTAPEQVGVYNYYLGQWAYQAKNWPEARDRFQKAIAAGYTDGDPAVLITETYFGEGQTRQGLDYFSKLLDERKAAGSNIPEEWVMRGLKVAVDAKLADKIVEYSNRLVENSPTPAHWSDAITLVASTAEPDKEGTLDMLRLMKATGALKQRNQYVEYVETAAGNGLPSEALAVLAKGKEAGIFQANGDDYYKEALALATSKSANDSKDAATYPAEAAKAPTGVTAQGAGDLFFSLGKYADAAKMYQLAIDKGAKDRELAVTRLGIAQVLSGDTAAGKATLAQVAGNRAAIAKLWMAYADTAA